MDTHGDYYDYFIKEKRGYEGRNFGAYKLKIDIPPFNRTLHIEEFIEWMVEVNLFFDCMNIPKDQQLKLVIVRFKGLTSA